MPNKSKSKTNTKSKTDKLNDIEFDKMLREFSKLDKLNNVVTEEKTPLAQALDDKKKDETRKKLKNAIYMKTQMRNMPPKKMIDEQTEELKNMMKHPRMNQEILQLYGKAIAYDPKTSIPKPTDIFDNLDHYMVEYYQYIRGLIKTMQEANISISKLDTILDNPYGKYMSCCLGCPLNPFKNSKNSNSNSNVNTVTVLENEEDNVPELVDI